MPLDSFRGVLSIDVKFMGVAPQFHGEGQLCNGTFHPVYTQLHDNRQEFSKVCLMHIWIFSWTQVTDMVSFISYNQEIYKFYFFTCKPNFLLLTKFFVEVGHIEREYVQLSPMQLIILFLIYCIFHNFIIGSQCANYKLLASQSCCD